MSATVKFQENFEAYDAEKDEAEEAINLNADEILKLLLEFIEEIMNKYFQLYPMNSNQSPKVKKSLKAEVKESKSMKSVKSKSKNSKKVSFSQNITIINQKVLSNKDNNQSRVVNDTTSSPNCDKDKDENHDNDKIPHDKEAKRKEAKNNLTKHFREAIKGQTNLIKINEGDKPEAGRFVIATMNTAGLRSKAQTVNNIARLNQVNAIVVSETHYSAKAKPYLSNYFKVFNKNRDKYKNACKGGIAVLQYYLDWRMRKNSSR